MPTAPQQQPRSLLKRSAGVELSGYNSLKMWPVDLAVKGVIEGQGSQVVDLLANGDVIASVHEEQRN